MNQTTQNIPDFAKDYVKYYAMDSYSYSDILYALAVPEDVQMKDRTHYHQSAYMLAHPFSVTAFPGYPPPPAIAPPGGRIYFAPQNQDELDGINGLADRGAGGDDVIKKAITLVEDTIDGDYLDGSSQGFQDALDNVEDEYDSTYSAIESRVGKKAIFVGDPDSTFLAKSLLPTPFLAYKNRMEALLYADNYRKERAFQDNSLGYAIELGKQATVDAETLRRTGVYARDYLQSTYQISNKVFIEGQEIDLVKLEIFGNALRALTGSMQKMSSDQKSSDMMQIVGGSIAAVGAAAGVYTAATAASAAATAATAAASAAAASEAAATTLPIVFV
jgi:hypothetical protein